MKVKDGTVLVRQVSDDRAYRECVAIRRQVFVEEQGVPAALELDEFETTATFFIARLVSPEDAGGGTPVGTGRYRVKGSLLKFERIATLASVRGRGVGRDLMKYMTEAGRAAHPTMLPYMHAQLSAAPFYDKLGWTRIGREFKEADIDHVAMILPPTTPGALVALACRKDESAPEAVRSWLAKARVGG